MTKWLSLETAPKEESHFLCKLPNGLVTTAFYHWYTEDAHTDGRDLAFWALHDAIRDEPLADDGYDEDYRWMKIPE